MAFKSAAPKTAGMDVVSIVVALASLLISLLTAGCAFWVWFSLKVDRQDSDKAQLAWQLAKDYDDVSVHIGHLAYFVKQLKARGSNVWDYFVLWERAEGLISADDNALAEARMRWMQIKAHMLKAINFWDRLFRMRKAGLLPRDFLQLGWLRRAEEFRTTLEPLCIACDFAASGHPGWTYSRNAAFINAELLCKQLMCGQAKKKGQLSYAFKTSDSWARLAELNSQALLDAPVGGQDIIGNDDMLVDEDVLVQ